MGVRAALLLLLALRAAIGSPPAPAGTKRSIEELQFGNQQNPPVSLLDDNALPGAFPSSETSEETVAEKEAAADSQEQQPKQEQQERAEQPQQMDSQQEATQQETEEDSLATAAQPSRWPAPATPLLHLYHPRWGVPAMYEDDTYPSRRRRSVPRRRQRIDPRKVPQVPLKVLRAGQRHKRDLRRYRRDLKSNTNLENLLRDVDVVELLEMLARPSRQNQGGYGTVSYAPAPPRYAPQPKLFPDYDEDEDVDDTGMKLLRQNVRPSHLPEPGLLPAENRVWRRSGGYGLSALPGFKRSAFRANQPQPPQPQAFNQDDVYSLAAMLGAELDPVVNRIRRVAM